MNLDDLNKKSFTKINNTLKTRFGYEFDENKLTENSAVEKINLLSESINAMKAKSPYGIERNPEYLKRVVAREALEAWVTERDTTGMMSAGEKYVVVNQMKQGVIPISKVFATQQEAETWQKNNARRPGGVGEIMTVSQAKQNIHPDRKNTKLEAKKSMEKAGIQKAKSAIKGKGSVDMVMKALDSMVAGDVVPQNLRKVAAPYIGALVKVLSDQTKAARFAQMARESYGKDISESTLVESDVEQAEAMLASKDFIDRIQGMIEDIGEMLNEDLPPLSDTIRDEMGMETAQSYVDVVNPALDAALEALHNTREQLDNGTRVLSGEEAPVMGPEPEDTTDTDDVDLSLDNEPTDDFEASPAASGDDTPIGREKRD